jgi:LEA14-like dessication related protein
MRKYILGSLFFAIAQVMTSCAFQPVYIENVEKPSMGSINSKNADVQFNVLLKNPNSMGFKLVKSDIDILVNGMNVGAINLASKTKVPANCSTSIPVSVKVDNNKLLSIGAMSLFGEPKVQLKGYIKGRKFIFPKKYHVDFQDNFSISDFLGQ